MQNRQNAARTHPEIANGSGLFVRRRCRFAVSVDYAAPARSGGAARDRMTSLSWTHRVLDDMEAMDCAQGDSLGAVSNISSARRPNSGQGASALPPSGHGPATDMRISFPLENIARLRRGAPMLGKKGAGRNWRSRWPQATTKPARHATIPENLISGRSKPLTTGRCQLTLLCDQ